MTQYFTMQVALPLSGGPAQTYVGARYLRRSGAIWELPNSPDLKSILEEHGMTTLNPVVTPALARNDDDEDEDEASTEDTDIGGEWWARVSSLLHAGQDIAFATNRVARSLAKPTKADLLSSKRLSRYLRGTLDLGLELQIHNNACTTLTVFTDSDWPSNRPTQQSVSSWVVILDGALIGAGARKQSVIAQSSCEVEFIAATAATSEAKYIQALFMACGQLGHIHLRKHWCHWSGKKKRSATLSSSGCPLLVVAGRNCCQTSSNQESTRAQERCRLKHQTCRLTFARVLSYVYGSDTDPETVS